MGSHISIRGKRWRIIFDKPPRQILEESKLPKRVRGLCDESARTIWANRGDDVRATLVHEILHACFPDLSEDAVCEAEEAIESGLKLLNV